MKKNIVSVIAIIVAAAIVALSIIAFATAVRAENAFKIEGKLVVSAMAVLTAVLTAGGCFHIINEITKVVERVEYKKLMREISQ